MNLGRNDLLQKAYRDLGRAAFRNELIFAAACLLFVVILWSVK